MEYQKPKQLEPKAVLAELNMLDRICCAISPEAAQALAMLQNKNESDENKEGS